MAQSSIGVDNQRLGQYLATQLDDASWERVQVELLSGGKSNLTYLARAGDKEVVLRRPPLGDVLPTAHDMVREFTALTALHPTDVPVPNPLHLCSDPRVLGVPFYVMERLHGHIVRNKLPEGYADEKQCRAIGLAVVDNLSKLHLVDWQGAGLEGFGHPEGFMARQVRRWTQQWERFSTREVPLMNSLIEGLRERLSESPSPTMVHGDYRVDNVVLDPEHPGSIVGILDWEMSTIGDPLADLGLLLTYWPQDDDSSMFKDAIGGITVTTTPGFPTRNEVVARYASATGTGVSAITYYWAFGFFKLAVILEGIHARFLHGKTVGEGFSDVGSRVVPLATIGAQILDRGELGAI